MAKLLSKSQKNVTRNYEIALKHYNNGAHSLAEEFCRNVLSAASGHAHALHLLGLVALSTGKNDVALDLASQAIARQPENPDFLNTLGVTCMRLGRLKEAVSHFCGALNQREAFPEAHANLGKVLQAQGALSEAESHYKKAIALRPGYSEALVDCSTMLLAQKRWHEMIFCSRQALDANPNQPLALFYLGYALEQNGHFAEAIEQYRQAVLVQPNFSEAHLHLGFALYNQGMLPQALPHYQMAIEINPDLPEAQNTFGNLLYGLGRLEEAEACYRKALEIRPDFPDPFNNLANLLKDQGQHQEARVLYRKALTLCPEYRGIRSNLLLTLHYDMDTEYAQIESAHKDWGDNAVAGISPILSWANDRAISRSLRIGFVSPNFYKHAVAFFLKDVFEALDPREVSLFCYSNNTRADELTSRLKISASGWRDIIGLNDGQVVQLIQDDEIDILVDLAGHTAHNRLMVFAHKPAPIQVTWLGYPNTTGLVSMDYRLTDEIADPPNCSGWHSEELIRLPEGFLCFGEPIVSPEISLPPCVSSGMITFGCFNNNAKINRRVIALWAEILRQLPESSFVLKNNTLSSPAAQEIWKKIFQEHGVSMDRLVLSPRLDSYADHLGLYGKVDIALDVFPYNGTTTTCEAMWMGVPVITLRGERHIGRVGASLLTQVGLEELIAETPEEYVEKAVALAGDRERLVALRHDLRERMRGSSLGDANRFARALEHAFRDMWLRWLNETEAGGES